MCRCALEVSVHSTIHSRQWCDWSAVYSPSFGVHGAEIGLVGLTREEIRMQVAHELQQIADTPKKGMQTLFRGSYEALRAQQLAHDAFRHKSETMGELLLIYSDQYPDFRPAYNHDYFFGP